MIKPEKKKKRTVIIVSKTVAKAIVLERALCHPQELTPLILWQIESKTGQKKLIETSATSRTFIVKIKATI